MKTKVYLKDWFYNAGVIGFLRIIQHSKVDFVTIKDNYIEFDTQELKKFQEYYFNYFFDIYNVAIKTTEKIEKSFSRITNLLLKETNDKQEEKQKQDQLKSQKKYIKLVIKSQLDKIKKVDESTYQQMFEAYQQMDQIKEKEEIEQLEQIKQILKQGLEKELINKRLTMNLFKSILSKSYFGQQSFLNVVKSSYSFEEQEKIMYQDYISNIIETGFLQDIVEEKYTIEQVKEILQQKLQDDLISKEVQKLYAKILTKFIKKEKSLEEIKQYISNEVFSDCYMCENDKGLTSNYSEGKFIPLAISSDNMKNFFWNQNAYMPVCDICKLILFCIPAGITSISKIIKENQNGKLEYKEKEVLSFINYDTDVETLLKVNNNFKELSKKDNSEKNPYSELILNIVQQEKQITQWQLQNIFIVEFEAEYLAFSRMEYFNIKRYVATFFKEHANKTLDLIKDNRYKLQIVDYMLKNKDSKYLINERLREELKQTNPFSFNSYLATKVRLNLQLLKKGEDRVEEKIKKNNAKLTVLYNLGMQIHEELKNKGEDNKLNGYTYKMLNSIKLGNKKEFMDIIIRIHMSMGKDVSPIFLEIIEETDLDLESVGHSFLAGLISNKYEKKEEEIKNEQ